MALACAKNAEFVCPSCWHFHRHQDHRGHRRPRPQPREVRQPRRGLRKS